MAVSRAMVLRAAAHVAVWLPFLTAVAGSVRGDWRVVGDGAGIASQSWSALTAHGPLVGHATQLAHGLYDPGPLEFWLLAVPVPADPVRGVLWGAALWCMAAGSLAIEAMWSVPIAAGTRLDQALRPAHRPRSAACSAGAGSCRGRAPFTVYQRSNDVGPGSGWLTRRSNNGTRRDVGDDRHHRGKPLPRLAPVGEAARQRPGHGRWGCPAAARALAAACVPGNEPGGGDV